MEQYDKDKLGSVIPNCIKMLLMFSKSITCFNQWGSGLHAEPYSRESAFEWLTSSFAIPQFTHPKPGYQV